MNQDEEEEPSTALEGDHLTMTLAETATDRNRIRRDLRCEPLRASYVIMYVVRFLHVALFRSPSVVYKSLYSWHYRPPTGTLFCNVIAHSKDQFYRRKIEYQDDGIHITWRDRNNPFVVTEELLDLHCHHTTHNIDVLDALLVQENLEEWTATLWSSSSCGIC